VKNKEKRREYSRKYRKENPEKVKEYNRKWKKENKEKVKEYNIKWQRENLEKKREYYKKNKKKIDEYDRKWKREYNQKPEVRIKSSIKRKTNRKFPLKNKLCEYCDEKAEEHHHYTEPYKFDKFWFVCKKHHLEIERGVELTK